LLRCTFTNANGFANFDRARFVGKAEISYRIVNHWVERSPDGRDISQIYSLADASGKILRVDLDDPGRERAMTFHFHEFDIGSQDASLWVVPPAIKAICNPATEKDNFLFDQ